MCTPQCHHFVTKTVENVAQDNEHRPQVSEECVQTEGRWSMHLCMWYDHEEVLADAEKARAV